MERSEKIPTIGSVALWIIGLIALRTILVMSGSEHPMLDATTPNPYYNPDLHNFIGYVGVGWTLLCMCICGLWLNMAKRHKE